MNWSSARASAGSLVVDHVDGDVLNNELTNLEPVCHGCNLRRGRNRRMEGQIVMERRGGFVTALERTCATCKKPFLVPKSNVETSKEPNKGTYCSRACRGRAGGVIAVAVNKEKYRAAAVQAAPRVMELRALGLSYAKIGATLDSEGIRPPKSEKWSVPSIYNIVRSHGQLPLPGF